MSEKYMVVQTVELMDGTVTNHPMDLFSEEKDAEHKCKELTGIFQHVSRWQVLRPNGSGGSKSAGDVAGIFQRLLGVKAVQYAVARVHETGVIVEPPKESGLIITP